MRRLWFWMKFVAVAGTTAVAILEILSINRKYTSSNSSFYKTTPNKAWRHRPVRVIAKTISFLTGAGLIASTIPLTENGNTTAAKICLISGCIVIVAGIAELIFIKRK